MSPPVALTTVAFVALAVLADLRTRSIPNRLSGAALLAGLALNGLAPGGAGLAASLLGAVLAGALLVPPFALGGVGGGDVKMMAAVGAFLGPCASLWALLLGMAAGGAVTIAHLAWRGRLREKLARTAAMVGGAARLRSIRPLRVSAGDADAVALPYSVPLGLGTVAVVAAASMKGVLS